MTPAYRIAQSIVAAADGWVLHTVDLTGGGTVIPKSRFMSTTLSDADQERVYRVDEPERFKAYWNQAPDQRGGQVYALFAFRSSVYAQDMAAAQTLANSEELELYVFARKPSRAETGPNLAEAELSEQRLADLIARLGDRVVSVGGLETGANDQGYHFARRRIVIRA